VGISLNILSLFFGMGLRNLIREYWSKEAIKKAEKKTVIEEKAWDGKSGVYYVDSEFGSNIQVVRLEKDEDGKLDVFCSCVGYAKGGFCNHIFAVYLYLLGKGIDLTKDLKVWAEERKKVKKDE
jgi:hypothetical protein